MPILTVDPTSNVCPSYDDEDHEFVRVAIIASHEGDPLTVEEAIAKLQNAWKKANDKKVTQWNEQMAEEQQRQEDEARQLEAERDKREIQLEKEEEEKRKEIEKKKPKINSFDPQRAVGGFIIPRPSAFALNKLDALDYVELDYFTTRGCKNAHAEHELSTNNNTYGLATLGDSLALQPLSSLRPSKNIRRDEDLSWDEMVTAKNNMIHFMSKSKLWPQAHMECIAKFYVALETHPMRQTSHGNRIVTAYAGRARREWFDALKRDEGFNLAIINPDLMKSVTDEIKDSSRDEEMAAVSMHVTFRRGNDADICLPLDPSVPFKPSLCCDDQHAIAVVFYVIRCCYAVGCFRAVTMLLLCCSDAAH
jgi:hypothetical protein